MLTSYAQNGEDIMLWRALSHIERGFYIDAGASDPVADSVTKMFYEHGWSGINVEPMPSIFARLEADRPRDTNLRCLLGEQPGEKPFFVVGEESGLSTSSAEYSRRHAQAGWALREELLPVATLAAICAEHAPPAIHFLKIDVEGDEEAVLRGADLARFRPWIVVAEATEPNSQAPAYAAFEPLLVRQGYSFVYFDGLNRFYLAQEHDTLRAAFDAPPNVFDRFERYRERQLREKVEELEARLGLAT